MEKWIKPIGAAVMTLFTAAVLLWWLFLVQERIGSVPVVDDDGNVILDEWQRAKDILLVIVPLFTAALGYWVGSKESETARAEAKDANAKAIALSTVVPEDKLTVLRDQYPDLF